MPSNPNCVPPPPSLSRWSGGFCTRGETRSVARPHRACLGGAGAWGQEKDGRGTAPLVQKPAPHRGEPGGGETLKPAFACAEACAPPGRARWGRNAETIACWCRSLRSTGASPVGARCWEQPLLVQKPLLHRGEPGGGGTRRPLLAGAEACAPPGRARWGRDAIRANQPIRTHDKLQMTNYKLQITDYRRRICLRSCFALPIQRPSRRRLTPVW